MNKEKKKNIFREFFADSEWIDILPSFFFFLFLSLGIYNLFFYKKSFSPYSMGIMEISVALLYGLWFLNIRNIRLLRKIRNSQHELIKDMLQVLENIMDAAHMKNPFAEETKKIKKFKIN